MHDPKLREHRRVMMERLQADPRDNEAARAFLALLDAIGATLQFEPAVVEEAKDRVVSEIYAKIHAGTLAPIQFPWAFLRKRLYWRALDVIADAQPKAPKALKPAPPPKPGCPFDDAAEVELLDRVYKLARRMRDPKHRSHLEAAWVRCGEWHRGPLTMNDLVDRESRASGVVDPRTIKTEYDRETRAQGRLRDALRDAVDDMEEGELLSANEATFAHTLIERLARCPKERPTGVQGAP